VVGPENWRNRFRLEQMSGGVNFVVCTIELKIDGEWIPKEDAGGFKEMTEKGRDGKVVEDEENTPKTAYSDSFKRAATAWGVGRYLYNDGAPIYPEEHVNGEVIEAPKKLTEGLYTAAHKKKTVEFVQWLGAKVAKVNEKWQDEWADELVRKQGEGHSVPDKMPDLVTTIQIKGHLLKWAIAAEWLDPAIVPEDVKPINCEAYVAKVFDDPDGKKAILAELGDYLQKQKRDKTAAFYRKHPHLATEEFVAEQAEAEQIADVKEFQRMHASAVAAGTTSILDKEMDQKGWEDGRE
jgi:hypothetical protein